ncbi:ribosome biogenesis protein SSF1/2 [Nematocida major]|uniref:ribosome biogenesis protein SSF1/2 n=1 Tax=Nematocida major TaxID=1912982 RepID=UPI002007B0D3|nr:ribosome biogenesis protein SSF1/2 [Nematocida major]KAH9385697.1 ribosome biogenesis protein SSF1/2 [Nematocida major]
MARRENKVVIKFGQVTASYAKLVQECRECFEPGVTRNLKEERKWRIKDYVQLARHFSASHIWAFSQSEEHNNLKVISLLSDTSKTFYFKIHQYMFSSKINTSTLNIGDRMNGYFIIPINIDKADPITELIEEIKNNVNVSHLTTRAITIKKLSEDRYLFTNYIIKKEERPGAENQVKLTLVERGPVMHLELQKIEKGICSGDVIYHRYIHKTPEELRERELRIQEREREKQRRKAVQEENVRRKKGKKEPAASAEESQDSDDSSEDSSPTEDSDKENVS